MPMNIFNYHKLCYILVNLSYKNNNSINLNNSKILYEQINSNKNLIDKDFTIINSIVINNTNNVYFKLNLNYYCSKICECINNNNKYLVFIYDNIYISYISYINLELLNNITLFKYNKKYSNIKYEIKNLDFNYKLIIYIEIPKKYNF